MNRTQILTLLHNSFGHNKYPTLHDVLTFIHSIPESFLPTSIVLCGHENEISLFWDNHLSFLDVGFDGSGTYQYEGYVGKAHFRGVGETHYIVDDIQQFMARFVSQNNK